MGQDLSLAQNVSVSPNKKWLFLANANAYVSVSSVCYFRVFGDYIVFKLLDHSSSKYDDDVVYQITSTSMTKHEISAIVDALTTKIVQ